MYKYLSERNIQKTRVALVGYFTPHQVEHIKTAIEHDLAAEVTVNPPLDNFLSVPLNKTEIIVTDYDFSSPPQGEKDYDLIQYFAELEDRTESSSFGPGYRNGSSTYLIRHLRKRKIETPVLVFTSSSEASLQEVCDAFPDDLYISVVKHDVGDLSNSIEKLTEALWHLALIKYDKVLR